MREASASLIFFLVFLKTWWYVIHEVEGNSTRRMKCVAEGVNSMTKKVRIAALGCGGRWIGLCSLYARIPGVEIVAVCDVAKGAAERAAAVQKENVGYAPSVYTSFEEMRKNEIYDAIVITADPDVQVDFAVAEMDRGIHVMTEVPAAYTIEQCRRLVDAVEKNGVKYQLAEQTRYWHFIRLWREMAQRGEFGKIMYAEGEYLHYEEKWDFFQHAETGERVWTNDPSYHNNPLYKKAWRYRAFMDPIWYLPHELSPLLSITGGRIERVSCLGTRKGESYTQGFDVRDLECALMYNSNDVIFSLRAGFTAPYGNKKKTNAHWYQIKGTKQSVEWARSGLDEPKLYRPETGWELHPEWGTADPDAEELFRSAPHGGADAYPLYDFVRAIIHDETPAMVVYRAVETAAPAIMAVQSAKMGGITLEVPDFRPAK